jgi:nitrate reductase gamma subunit
MVESMLLALSYASLAVFVAAVVVRAVRLARLPLHLRWELYPVAHEKGRARYGGSYLEELNWWTKPRQSSLLGELRVMLAEIVLLKGVWEHNRRQWLRSFPFHFGLYLLAALIVLLLAGGITIATGGSIAADGGWWGRTLYGLTPVVGYAGLALALIGSLALLIRRRFEPDYREYTKKADYFNLAFFVVALGVAIIAHTVADPHFASLRAYFGRLVTFDFSAPGAAGMSLTGLSVAEVVVGGLLLAYIPLTHMSHFFTKWFMYHDIRWSDEPNLRGGKIEREIETALRYPVSWAAPHIRGDGHKTWLDVATSGAEEKKP